MKRVPMEVLEFDRSILKMLQTDEAEDNGERLKRLKRAMRDVIKNELTPRQREVINMRFFDGLSGNEIAGKLGLDHSTVSRTLARARKNVYDRLKYFYKY